MIGWLALVQCNSQNVRTEKETVIRGSVTQFLATATRMDVIVRSQFSYYRSWLCSSLRWATPADTVMSLLVASGIPAHSRLRPFAFVLSPPVVLITTRLALLYDYDFITVD